MAEEPQAPLDPDAMMAASARRIREIEREMRRVSRDDWDGLFRQMGTLLTTLAQHPFLRGDAEAEARLAEMFLAGDLEEFDRRTDRLAEYVYGKLDYNLALRAAAEAESQAEAARAEAVRAAQAAGQDAPDKPDPPAAAPAPRAQSPRGTQGTARRLMRSGPSGDDFDLGPDPDDDPDEPTETPPRRQRSRLRL